MALFGKKVFAVIPARGGSKGIIDKNLQTIDGTSLVARCIVSAKSSLCIDQVIVTTDCDRIAKESILHGALVVDRPATISGDMSSSEDAILHALDILRGKKLYPDITVFLQCTCPLLEASHIDSIVKELIVSESKSVFAAVPWHGFLWSQNGDGINHDPCKPRSRRQDIQNIYKETGSIYAFETEDFMKNRTRFSMPCKPLPVCSSSIDIDSIEDLELARMLYALRSNKTNQLASS